MKSAYCASLLALLVACVGGSPAAPEPVPFITGLSPSLVRAGQEVTISGGNLSQGVVLLDGQPIDAISLSSSEITFRVPMNATPGALLVAVRSSGGTTGALALEVEIFTVTGRYSGIAIGLANTCDPDGDPGTISFFEASMVDERPDLTVRLWGWVFRGELERDGSFRAQDILADFTLPTLEGQVGIDGGGIVFFDAILTVMLNDGCIGISDLNASRVSETL